MGFSFSIFLDIGMVTSILFFGLELRINSSICDHHFRNGNKFWFKVQFKITQAGTTVQPKIRYSRSNW